MPDRDWTGRASAATVPHHRAALARPAIGSWVLRVATAAALGIDAVVHWQNAPAYDAVGTPSARGCCSGPRPPWPWWSGCWSWFGRGPAAGWPRCWWPASALGAVLLYRYVDVGTLGPLPDMYENTWQVPGKLLSAYAEGAAVVFATLGLLTHRTPGWNRRFQWAATGRKRG